MIALYVIQFTGNSPEDVTTEAMAADTLSSEGKGEKSGRIYYVNTDTVWGKYQFVVDVTNRLQNKQSQYEGQIQRELQNFEREVTDFREKGAMMSEVEVQIKQRDLMRKEQELQKMSEDLELRFMNEEKEWNDKLRKKIVDYIREKTSDRSYDYILGYSIASNIIIANDSLDLTSEIVNGLNIDYEMEQSQKEAK